MAFDDEKVDFILMKKWISCKDILRSQNRKIMDFCLLDTEIV